MSQFDTEKTPKNEERLVLPSSSGLQPVAREDGGHQHAIQIKSFDTSKIPYSKLVPNPLRTTLN